MCRLLEKKFAFKEKYMNIKVLFENRYVTVSLLNIIRHFHVKIEIFIVLHYFHVIECNTFYFDIHYVHKKYFSCKITSLTLDIVPFYNK